MRLIRANLLPRRGRFVALFGWKIEVAYLREALAGVATVGMVAAIGLGVGEVRVRGLEAAAMSRETALAGRSAQRELSKRLALDVARYQEFGREATAFRSSGAAVAIAVARIGNSVPNDVWLESLDRDAGGYTLAGASASIDVMSGTVASLGHALPDRDASLISIDNHPTDSDDVRFRAHLADPNTPTVPEARP